MTVPARLLLLLDSRSPAGAHSHSGGVEAAVSAGFVSDVDSVRDFCAFRLRTTGRVAAAFAAAAALAWSRGADAEQWRNLDEEFSARTPSQAVRASSRALGGGLRRLVQATVPAADLATAWRLVPRPHQPLVLGAGCALAGGTPLLAARASALGTCTAPASAALRLLGLDPYRVHTITAELCDEIDAVALGATADPAYASAGISWLTPGWLAALPSDSAPALDLLADVHVREGMRLFAS